MQKCEKELTWHVKAQWQKRNSTTALQPFKFRDVLYPVWGWCGGLEISRYSRKNKAVNAPTEIAASATYLRPAYVFRIML